LKVRVIWPRIVKGPFKGPQTVVKRVLNNGLVNLPWNKGIRKRLLGWEKILGKFTRILPWTPLKGGRVILGRTPDWVV